MIFKLLAESLSQVRKYVFLLLNRKRKYEKTCAATTISGLFKEYSF